MPVIEARLRRAKEEAEYVYGPVTNTLWWMNTVEECVERDFTV